MKIDRNERIFVAGSRGMAGQAICRSLQKMVMEKMRKEVVYLLLTEKLNLFDYNSIIKWFKENKPTVVILAAAKVGGIFANSSFPGDFILENLKIQTNVIEASWKMGVKRFYF